MRIMGIDPGLAIVGYGVVDSCGGTLQLVDYGTLTTPAGMPLPERLHKIHTGVSDLMQRYQPDHVAFEELFFCRNVTTAIAVGQARGVAVMAARCAFDGGIYEYTPMQVKQAVSGYGRADKKQVQAMVRLLLRLDHEPKPDDAADALAVAICHTHSHTMAGQFMMR